MIRLLIILIMLLPSCTTIKKGLGFEKDIPDEFLIKKNDPITKPPFYKLIPPGSKKNSNLEKDLTNAKVKDIKKAVYNEIGNNSKNENLTDKVKNNDTSLENEILDKIR